MQHIRTTTLPTILTTDVFARLAIEAETAPTVDCQARRLVANERGKLRRRARREAIARKQAWLAD